MSCSLISTEDIVLIMNWLYRSILLERWKLQCLTGPVILLYYVLYYLGLQYSSRTSELLHLDDIENTARERGGGG